KTIDFELVRCALDELRAHSNSNGNGSNGNGKMAAGVRFGDFTESLLKNRAFHPDYVRRNVMWLVKHGLVKPALVAQFSEPRGSHCTQDFVSGREFAQTVEK